MTVILSTLPETTTYSIKLGVLPCEQSLVAALRSKDQRSIASLYKMYAPALMGIISRIVKCDELAEDALQETFVKIWKSIDQYQESKGRLFTWMPDWQGIPRSICLEAKSKSRAAKTPTWKIIITKLT